MNLGKWDKYGLILVMFAAFFGGIFTESRSVEGATVFFSVALVTFGVLITMVVGDWWIDRHRQQELQDRSEDRSEEEGHL